MRSLSRRFLDDLQQGTLKELREQVCQDKDLDLQIRDGYLNIYYKGHALLKLIEQSQGSYRIEIHPEFRGKQQFEPINDPGTAERFMQAIPVLKAAINQHGTASLEIEYEQLIIRANNREQRIASEYIIVDRQYASGGERFDLLGIHWPREGRRRGQTIAPCIFEIKYGLNNDIQTIHAQLQRYYNVVAQDPARFASEIQASLRLKLELGLIAQPQDRRAAMQTLTVAPALDQFQFIVVLVDFNPASRLFEQARKEPTLLPFASQIRLRYTGFALWEHNLMPVSA